ncbi:MAG TPA: protein kinase [Bryobacteraceae bacterium]|nr:protein kinase [Bryobacteraceae bacterium]
MNSASRSLRTVTLRPSPGASLSERVEELFHAVADLSEEARGRYFAAHDIDAATRREVEALLGFDSESSISLDKHIGHVAQGTLERFELKDKMCGPYRVGELLGRGGMGTVHLAERVDGEVTQRAAVKLLGPGAEDPLMRQRFLAERQILATLSHPNIARLLDAGHREDGQPYLVMEYVEGQSIDKWTAGLSTRHKIRLFLKVCAAVGYLHRNLVVHRDLKPANILVTDEDEPKLLDFGIAKMLDLSSNATMTGTQMLTPDYASPEQVTGGPVTTATDIYSSGAVLYKLLTGVSPHRFQGDSVEAITSAICTGRILPPSKLAPALKGDLDIILMKALRKEPQERYATIEQFADDLQSYLESGPISARRGETWYRVRKLLRRHWVSAVATALVIASLSAGLYAANRQRVIAERRFDQLRQLSRRVIDLDGTIRTLPGSVAARQRLVAASLEYLEGLSHEASGNMDLAQETADGYWRMARILGVNGEFNLGDHAKAEENLQKADRLIETVLAHRPGDRNALLRSAVIAQDRMMLADAEQRRADTLAHASKAVGRVETFLSREDPQHPVRLEGFLRAGEARQSERIAAAGLLSNIALAYVNMHLYSDGARYARRAVELSRSVNSLDYSAHALGILANALRYQGDLENALSTIREARQVSEKTTYASETTRFFNLYGLVLREGLILGEADAVNLDRPAEAIERFETALKITEEAASKDPHDSASRGRVGTSARGLGDLLRDRDPRRAVSVFDLGIQRLREAGNSLNSQRELATLLAKSSYPLRRLERRADAKARIDAALGILKETKDYPSERIRLASQSYWAACALADYDAEAGNLDRALATYEQLLNAVMATDPEPLKDLRDAPRMSRIYEALGDLYSRTGNPAKAAVMNSHRLDLWRHWQVELPDNPFVRRQLSAANPSR